MASEEDLITYQLQAAGPDEYPEGYYRSIAREQLREKALQNLPPEGTE